MPEEREKVDPGAEQVTEEQPSLLEEIVDFILHYLGNSIDQNVNAVKIGIVTIGFMITETIFNLG